MSKSSLHSESSSIRTGQVRSQVVSIEQQTTTTTSRQNSVASSIHRNSSSSTTIGSSVGHGTITNGFHGNLVALPAGLNYNRQEKITVEDLNIRLASYISFFRSKVVWSKVTIIQIIELIKRELARVETNLKVKVDHFYELLIKELAIKVKELEDAIRSEDREIKRLQDDLYRVEHERRERIKRIADEKSVGIAKHIKLYVQIHYEAKLVQVIKALRKEFLEYCAKYRLDIDVGDIEAVIIRRIRSFFIFVYEKRYAISCMEETIEELDAEIIYLKSVLRSLDKQITNLSLISKRFDYKEFIEDNLVLYQQGNLGRIDQEIQLFIQKYGYLLNINFDSQFDRYTRLLHEAKLKIPVDIDAYIDQSFTVEGHGGKFTITKDVHGSGYVGLTHRSTSSDHQHSQQLTNKGHLDKKVVREAVQGSGYVDSVHKSANVQSNGSSKVDVVIDEVSLQGDYIRLRNNGTKKFFLGSWIIKAIAPKPTGDEIRKFKLQSNQELSPGKTITIWSPNRGGDNNPPESYVMKDVVWPTYNRIRVELYDPNEKEEKGHLETYYDIEVLKKSTHIL